MEFSEDGSCTCSQLMRKLRSHKPKQSQLLSSKPLRKHHSASPTSSSCVSVKCKPPKSQPQRRQYVKGPITMLPLTPKQHAKQQTGRKTCEDCVTGARSAFLVRETRVGDVTQGPEPLTALAFLSAALARFRWRRKCEL